jgi:hypothetical protein
VVDESHGRVVASLQVAERCEDRHDFAGGVLVDAMQTHEGIEHEEPGLQALDGVVESFAIA